VVDTLPLLVDEECVFFERSVNPYDVTISLRAIIIVFSDQSPAHRCGGFSHHGVQAQVSGEEGYFLPLFVNERAMMERIHAVDWFLRRASKMKNKILTTKKSQRQRIEISLTLPFLDLSDEPPPPPSPSLLSSTAVSAMLSSVSPSMMRCVKGGVSVVTTEIARKGFS
jgi:hypothetical protein